MTGLLEKFQNFINKNTLVRKNESTLLAVSGGVDSVVMAALFYEAKLPFGIAHCNFGLRGEQSDLDEKFVTQLAEKYNVPCYIKKFNTTTFAAENKISIQMAARSLRYEWFEEIRNNNEFHWIATAHHQNDIAETVFLNFIKGTGIAGLHGIFPKKGKLIRPLLFAEKKEIEKYAHENSLSFRLDRSNLSDDYERNKTRNIIFPALEAINPNVQKNLVNNAFNLYETELIYKEGLEKIMKKLTIKDGMSLQIPINKLKLYPFKRTLLFEILKGYGFNFSQVENILNRLDGNSGKVFLSLTHKLIIDRSHILIDSLNPSESQHFLIDDNLKKIETENGIFKFKTVLNENFKIPADSHIAALDMAKLQFPLLLRRWKTGDYFYPIGMHGKKKKVSDFFIDKKLSLSEKEKTWILVSGEKIAWVAGLRMDERFKITSRTSKVLIVEYSYKKRLA